MHHRFISGYCDSREVLRATLSWDERIQWDMTFGATLDRTHSVEIRNPATNAVLLNCHTLSATANTTVNRRRTLHIIDLRFICICRADGSMCTFQKIFPRMLTGPGLAEIDNVVLSTQCSTAIPTLSQWSLIVLGLILATLGLVSILNKKRLGHTPPT